MNRSLLLSSNYRLSLSLEGYFIVYLYIQCMQDSRAATERVCMQAFPYMGFLSYPKFQHGIGAWGETKIGIQNLRSFEGGSSNHYFNGALAPFSPAQFQSPSLTTIQAIQVFWSFKSFTDKPFMAGDPLIGLKTLQPVHPRLQKAKFPRTATLRMPPSHTAARVRTYNAINPIKPPKTCRISFITSFPGSVLC